MKFDPLILREKIQYNPETGDLFYKYDPDKRAQWNGRHVGQPAFNSLQSSGYLQGQLDRYKLLAHHVAFAHYHGYWPTGEVKHLNGNKRDNRIANLQDTGNIGRALNRLSLPL